MKVAIVYEEGGEYSGRYWNFITAFKELPQAEAYVQALYDAGCASSDGYFEAKELDLWDTAEFETVTVYSWVATVQKGLTDAPRGWAHNSTAVVPCGQAHTLFRSSCVVDLNRPEWATIDVAALTSEECAAEFGRLHQEFLHS